jgi:hypothetical protein
MTPSVGELLAQIALPDTLTEVYAAPLTPSNSFVEITSIWICNTGVVDHLLTLRYGRSPTSLLNSLFNAAPIELSRTYIIFDGSPIKMRPGFIIDGFADVADTIVISIWGNTWRG